MRCIIRKDTDPYFNLAAEEFVVKNFEEDTFMLWRNEPSVIIGKHQNTFAEINTGFIRKHNIKVVRRISGGGAVYHDLGNLNFSFTSKGELNKLVDFDKFTQPIVRALKKLGIDVQTGNRNSLYIDGLKISGNAEHVFKNKVLHHGTLLFAGNLYDLNEAIKPSGLQYDDKAVKSVRSSVTNISNYLAPTITIEAFAQFILNEMLESNPDAYLYEYTPDDILSIEQLRNEKYNTWEWNWGYSPAFNYGVTIHYMGQSIPVSIFVVNGMVDKVEFRQSDKPAELFYNAMNSLTGVPLREADITGKLHGSIPDNLINGIVSAILDTGTVPSV